MKVDFSRCGPYTAHAPTHACASQCAEGLHFSAFIMFSKRDFPILQPLCCREWGGIIPSYFCLVQYSPYIYIFFGLFVPNLEYCGSIAIQK